MTPTSQDAIVIGISDLKRLFRKLLPQLKWVALLCACAVFSFLLLKQPKYLAQASFKQSNSGSESGVRLKDIFQGTGFGTGESAALSIMQSLSVLRNAVEELGLQVDCEERFLLTRVMERIWDNLAAEMGREISDPDLFLFRKVKYDGESELSLYLKPLDDLSFEILDAGKQPLGKWKLNESISISRFKGILSEMPKRVRYQKLYRLTVSPWVDTVTGLQKFLEIKTSKIDRNILSLTFLHRDRFLASRFVNQVMASYQKHLRKENEEIIGAQLSYLEKRQEELTQKWDESLQEHVCYLKNNLGADGYFSLRQEIEMLSTPQNLFTSKLFDVDLEMKRLEGIPSDLLAHVGSFRSSSKKDPKGRSKGEALDVKKKTLESFSPLFLQKAALESVHSQHPLENKKLELDQRLTAVSWGQEKLSAQRIPFKQLESQEFAGLTLETAQSLYLNYNTSRDALQSQLRQLIYLLEEISNPDFELSSITTILSDTVTQEMVHKASLTAVQLRDESNRSPREQEHLRQTLETQKTFIGHHLGQTIELVKLRITLIEDKIASLQQTTIELLKQEKSLIQQKLKEITGKMENLPEKWRRENLLMLKKELGMHMVEGMTQLAESKNIDQHLFQVGSKVLDASFAPKKPRPARLFLYPLIAAAFGACAYYFYKLCRAVFQGLPVSHETLLISGFRSLGELSPYCNSSIGEMGDRDLETLRRVTQFLTSGPKNRCCALIGGKHPDYSHSLAELLAMQGLKVLIVHYVFDAVHPDQFPGLWQHLSGEVSDVPIRSHSSYDFLPCGATSRYGVEMLSNPKFASFLERERARYDLVLIYSKAMPQFAEAQAFRSVADVIVVTAHEEKREDLTPYREWEEKKSSSCVAFVCFEPLISR